MVKAPGPCTLNRSSRHNWVEDEGGLPNYICQVASAIVRSGKTIDQAVPIAIATMARWAVGGGGVSDAVKARAAAALAEFEAKAAAAKAKGVAGVETDFDLSVADYQLALRITRWATFAAGSLTAANAADLAALVADATGPGNAAALAELLGEVN